MCVSHVCVFWSVIYSNYNFISLFKFPSLNLFWQNFISSWLFRKWIPQIIQNEHLAFYLDLIFIHRRRRFRRCFFPLLFSAGGKRAQNVNELKNSLDFVNNWTHFKLAPRSRNENNEITAAAITTTKIDIFNNALFVN